MVRALAEVEDADGNPLPDFAHPKSLKDTLNKGRVVQAALSGISVPAAGPRDMENFHSHGLAARTLS